MTIARSIAVLLPRCGALSQHAPLSCLWDGFVASISKSMRLCASVACFVQAHVLCFRSLNCCFPRCVCAFPACIVQATLLHCCCSLHCFLARCGCVFASWIVQSTFLCFCSLKCFFPRCVCAFAACIGRATPMHICCSFNCFFSRCGCAFAACIIDVLLLAAQRLHTAPD